MMYGMKGEWPEDVKKPEEVKAVKEKKPFYKQGKWWLLAAVATLMAVATGYGMWLGSQYVKAVENAAHIIAEAQEPNSERLKKNRAFANTDNSGICRIDLGTRNWYKVPAGSTWPVRFYFTLGDIEVPNASNIAPQFMSADYNIVTFSQISSYGNPRGISGLLSGGYHYVAINVEEFEDLTEAQVQTALSGKYLYFKRSEGSSWPLYTDGIYQDGYNEGYDVGYQDGLDTDDLDQEVRIVYNTAIGSYARYDVYIDGAATASYSGRVGSDQHDEAFVTLNRNAGEVWKIVITANSAVHLAYTSSLRHLPPRWPLLTPQLEDNGVYAFPTTWSQVGFYIADQVDDANAAESWDLRLDPSINQAAIGTYGRGYADGYEEGKQDGDAEGYERGFAEGEDTAQEAAYNRGLNDGNGFGKSLSGMFVVAFQQPFDAMYRYLNFNFLGINFLAIFAGMLTLGLGIYVIKKVM